MEYTLYWNSEEEGILTFFDNDKTEWLCFNIFVLGEEAELVIKRGSIVDKCKKLDSIGGKLLDRLEDCIWKACSLLWKRGIEEVFFVEKQGELLIQALREADRMERVYSEYMMKRKFSTEDRSSNLLGEIEITIEEDSFVCENKERSFFCRLLPYQEDNSFYLYEVEVLETVRNRGVATNCLRQLFSELVKKREAVKEVTIYLQVGSYNEPALHLYQKLGFELSEEICYNVIKD